MNVITFNVLSRMLLPLAVSILWLAIGGDRTMAASTTYRRQMNAMRSMAQKAYEHGMRINEEATCARPRPELVYLTDSNKIFLPRATLLHRCSDLTGCCPHATQSCQPIRTHNVSLYFFTISVQSTSRLRQNQKIEVLKFVNHTDCACMPVERMRSELMRHNATANGAGHNDDNLLDEELEGNAVDGNVNISPTSDLRPPHLYSPLDALGDELSAETAVSRQASTIVPRVMGEDGVVVNITDTNATTEDVYRYWARLLGLYKTKTESKRKANRKNGNEPSEEEKILAKAGGVGGRQQPTPVDRAKTVPAKRPGSVYYDSEVKRSADEESVESRPQRPQPHRPPPPPHPAAFYHSELSALPGLPFPLYLSSMSTYPSYRKIYRRPLLTSGVLPSLVSSSSSSSPYSDDHYHLSYRPID